MTHKSVVSFRIKKRNWKNVSTGTVHYPFRDDGKWNIMALCRGMISMIVETDEEVTCKLCIRRNRRN